MSAKRFVRFIELYDRDAADMTNVFTQLIEVMGVYIDYCSGYDNASNMSSIYQEYTGL